MNCVYPQCSGTLHAEHGRITCTLCRRPIRTCQTCQAPNRAAAAFCRQCALPLEPQLLLPINPATLDTDPIRTQIDRPIRNAPQPGCGLLWFLTDDGALHSLNPLARTIDRLQTVAHLWAGAQVHGFAIRPLQRSPSSALTELHALIATPTSLQARGLVTGPVTGQAFTFTALLPGETILADARDAFQMVEAAAASLFCLTRREGQTFLLEANPFTSDTRRTPIGPPDLPLCGPVLVAGHLILWSADMLWTLNPTLPAELPQTHPLPPGLTLWTSPADATTVRLPVGTSPTLLHLDTLFLPAVHYGAPVLLHAQFLALGWTITILPIPHPGVLASTHPAPPLLAAEHHLFTCTPQGFRELRTEEQLSGHFAAFADPTLSVYFCHSNYGGYHQQWLRSWDGSTERPVRWQLTPGRTLRECAGFWSIDGTLTTQLLTESTATASEFLSWSA